MARQREVWTTTMQPELLAKLRELSDKTRVPMSKYADEAIEDLLIKHKAMKPKSAAPKKAPAKKAAAGDPPAGSPQGNSKA